MGIREGMDPRVYWVGFNLVRGIGSVRIRNLLDHFGNLAMAWDAPSDALQASGLSAKLAENIIQLRRQVDLAAIWDRIEKQQITVLTWEDVGYPARLKEIEQPPPILYLRGHLAQEDSWAVAVVGTRRVTSYGRQVAEELGAYLARNGVTVVSGLARGVDAIAHSAALAAGGRTLAVLGCGVDRIYPPEHRHLAEQVIAHGCLLSDYAPGTPPDSANFPPRNRIISGLSMATVVVEAGQESGALITASFAAEQGREVFALPGSIYSAQSKGTNRLILEGARPLLNMQDVLEALNLTMIHQQQTARTILPADATEARLLSALSYEPVHMDEICVQSGLPIEKVSATLALMELKGMVRQMGGMNYVMTREIPEDYRFDG
jgi:DNA processing protein